MPRPSLPRLNPYAHSQNRIDFYISRVYPPIVALAERVGRFEGPFAALRDERYGFCSSSRFHLDYCLSGDPLAIRAGEYVRCFERMRLLGESHPILQSQQNLRSMFFDVRLQEYFSFRERYFPWESNPEIILGKYPYVAELTGLLDSLVSRHLPFAGFTLRRRGLVPTWKADLNGYILELQAEMQWRAAGFHLRLEIPHVGITDPLGYPFFFSGSTFPLIAPTALERPLSVFFAAYSQVFPFLLQAFREGISNLETAWKKARNA